MTKLKNPQLTKGKKFGLGPESVPTTDWRKKNPTFSLQHTVQGYCISDCNQEQKAAFASTLLQLGKRTWLEILQSSKHASGSEKIPRYRLDVPIPNHIPEDQEFTVVRFHNMNPMIGYVQQGVYYIVWLDRNHTCYGG